MVDLNLIQMVLMMWGIGNSVSDQLLQQQAIQELINSDQQFDLILIEGFFNDAFLGFVHKFKVPFIQIITFGGLHWMHDWVGNTSPYAYVPEAFLGFGDKMNFCERLQNTLMITFEKVTRRIMFIPEQQRLIEKYFGQFGPPPSVDDIHASTSLVFLNNHFSTSYPRPLLPNIVEVGVWICLVLTPCLNLGESARILGIFPFPGKSHWAVHESLIKELAKRGHELTVITPFPEKSPPKYKEIVIQNKLEDNYNDTGHTNSMSMVDSNIVKMVLMIWGFGNIVCDQMLQQEAIQELINSDEQFDLIMMEGFFNDAFLGFVHKFKAPLIQILTFGGLHWMHDWVGNTSPYAYVPETFLGFSDKMNFWERLQNTLMITFDKVTRMFMFIPEQQKIMEKHFGKFGPLPSIDDIHASTSLMFLNNHFSISYPRPLLPNIVEVGGMHIKPPKKYRENAQQTSKIYKDQPLTPLETAVFWTEYVIQHKGAPHMRSAALDLSWYQYFLLDVIAVLAIASGIVLLVPVFILRILFKKCFGRSNSKSKVMIQRIILLICLLSNFSDCARILGIFPTPAKSHMIINSAYMQVLANRGHHVTVFSALPMEKPIPNYKDVIFNVSYADLFIGSATQNNMYDFRGLWYYEVPLVWWTVDNSVCEKLFQDEYIQRLLRSTEKEFDLLVIAAFFNDCALKLVHKLQVPVIKICPFGGANWMDEWVGNPTTYSYVPDIYQGLTDRMTFWERLKNTLGHLYVKAGRQFYSIPKQEAIVSKYVKQSQTFPSIYELQKKISLVFVNGDITTNYPRPIVPNFVGIGGIHVKAPKKLPKELDKFINESTHGVIYFSMDSNLRSSKMSEDKIQAFLKAFSMLKQRILWKWETDTLEGQPDNVKLGKWFPQSDILGKFALQKFTFKYLTQKLINPFLHIFRYSMNAKWISKIHHDQFLTPEEKAVYWTEYVIRHNGTQHMRSAALDLSWYQYFLLDIIFVFSIILGVILLVSFWGCLMPLLIGVQFSEGAKILAFFTAPSQSHMNLKSALLKELVTRGHHVTVVTALEDKTPTENYVEILVPGIMDALRKVVGPNIYESDRQNFMKIAFESWAASESMCRTVLSEPNVQKLINSKNQNFDLLILEAFFSECYIPFGEIFKIPIIKFCTFGGTHWMGDWVGNPNPYSYVPDAFYEYSDRMDFWERSINAFTGLFYKLGRHFYFLPRMDSVVREFFNETEPLPPLWELDQSSTSLLLVNSHFSISYPRPLVPNLVQVGGLHVKPPKKLPADL
ncbi:hypothetical protein C0J52_16000 [Blattella germanica]|nr:hypothetical protein C0J52_16000 [Blattella germanica]